MNKNFNLLLPLLVLLASYHIISAQNIINNEIIVELEDGYSIKTLDQYLSKSTWTIKRKLSRVNEIYLLENSDKASNIFLEDSSLFKYTMNNHKVERRELPNDTLYNFQWDLKQIGIEEAWNQTTGGYTVDGDEIVVAVLDDGFYMEHVDLQGTFYSNPHDQPGDMNNDGCPGVCGEDDDGDGLIDEDFLGRLPGDPNYDSQFYLDDDENGYKDDTNGLNATTASDNHPVRSHGTSVTGIIGAQTNNETGVSGINWNIKVLPLTSGLSVSDVIESYEYINEMRRQYNESDGERGAFIVACNYSLGINYAFPEDYPIWCNMYDKMGKNGIINVSAVTNDNYNVTDEGDIPTLCPSDYLFTVTSTDKDDLFAENGFGIDDVDIAAPGDGTYTVDPIKSNGFGTFNGNSAAAPHVAGVIGLLYSIPCPEFLDYFKTNPSKVDTLIEIIKNSSDELPSLFGLTGSEGRLNVFNTMIELNRFCGASFDDLIIENVFPNAVENELNFTFKADPREKIYVEIYNILGQKIYSEVMDFRLFEKPESTVNTSNLIPGLYFLSLNQGKKRAAYKFYKQ